MERSSAFSKTPCRLAVFPDHGRPFVHPVQPSTRHAWLLSQPLNLVEERRDLPRAGIPAWTLYRRAVAVEPRLICPGSVRAADVARQRSPRAIDLILDPARLRAFVVDD